MLQMLMLFALILLINALSSALFESQLFLMHSDKYFKFRSGSMIELFEHLDRLLNKSEKLKVLKSFSKHS